MRPWEPSLGPSLRDRSASSGGGVIGYVAGRQINCDLGVERCYRHVRYRRSGYRAASTQRRTEKREHIRGPGDLGTREDHGNY